MELRNKYELIDWLINNISHPDFEKRLSELHNVEVKEYAKEKR